MPWLLIHGDDDDDAAELLKRAADCAVQLVYDDDGHLVGYVVVASIDRAKRARAQARERSRKYRASRSPRDGASRSERDGTDEFGSDLGGISPSPGPKGPGGGGGSPETSRNVTRDASRDRHAVERDARSVSPLADASRYELPPMTDEQRETGRAAAAEIRARLQRGEL